MSPTTTESLPEVLVDLADLRAEAYHNPTIVTALALVSIAVDVRAMRRESTPTPTPSAPMHVIVRGQGEDEPAEAGGQSVRGSCLACVECQDTVQIVHGDVEKCFSCGFVIVHAEAQRIRARVEGTDS